MKLSKFKFYLPDERIALHPVENRDESRLMIAHRKTKKLNIKFLRILLNILMKMTF